MKVVIQKLDTPNKNKRIYSTAVMQETLSQCKDQVIVGTIGYPEDLRSIPLTEVSHSVGNLRIEDDALVGDVKILDTPKGIELRRLVEESGMEFRVMGYGTVNTRDDGNVDVTKFELVAVCAASPDVAS